MSLFESGRTSFRIAADGWRAPQRGALGALLAHWTLTPAEPALISLPTGTGKTGVALAAPFVTPEPPKRVLVLVPSRALREQTVPQFADLDLLRSIGALPHRRRRPRLRVHKVTGTSTDWDAAAAADVVVAIPQSVSPASAADVSVPPSGMFDLVIVDEAHHVPSLTWSAILEHLDSRSALLLTATPFRLDNKRLPGTNIFHFPLRQAIDQSFYRPVRPLVLPRPEPLTHETKDRMILDEVVRIAARPEHRSSALMVRASSIQRARELADLYREAGINIEPLTQKTSYSDYESITGRLKDGSLQAVSVVGMLGEGYDLPRLRLVAYHDKHKSLPATVQLVGRLARVSEEYPQESVLVTVDDGDVYPELQSVVRDLYKEDADWATILPGIVDAEIEADKAVRDFADALELRQGRIDPMHLQPMPTPTVFEVAEPLWKPVAEGTSLPAELDVGRSLGGAEILTALVADHGRLIVLVTRRRSTPRWCTDPSVESIEYGLTVISYRAAPRIGLPALLFVDAEDKRIGDAVVKILNAPDNASVVDPERLDGYLQSLPRISVSSIGMRNILAGTRGTAYKTRAGSSTDIDLGSIETTQTALGHVMMQIRVSQGSTTVGAALEKGKIWQRRYKTLVDYAAWVTEAAELLWFPRSGDGSPLLPQVPRGRAISEWPLSIPIAVEMNQAVAVGGLQLVTPLNTLIGSVEDLELHAGVDPTGGLTLPNTTARELPIVALMTDRSLGTQTVCWTGVLICGGGAEERGTGIRVKHGYSEDFAFTEFLDRYPPMVYFASGEAVQGREIFDVNGGNAGRFDHRDIETINWKARGVDIESETRETAARKGLGVSIHEGVEEYLRQQPRRAEHRWILYNDGSGEIADHIVIEHTPGGVVHLSLWHSKAAGGAPSLRVNDLQVVVGQALRSRSRYHDPQLWASLRRRLTGQESPAATLVDGSDGLARLLVYLGAQRSGMKRRGLSWERRPALMHGEIGIVQPGLSSSALAHPTSAQRSTAESIHQLLAVFADTVATTGSRALVLAS